ncbi:hypothetical protein HanXRQr2_Chr11g0499321 [Helianthus annuus]|uniref:Uncharacterized protein n=1 Tax=Helianthus annuus TaxID=4232 RepID=A0A9K3N0Q7_HELAN|nr:hypothetical protein HanXRQr2_Chr11g0499321 [Helianthus annuus]KAJ0875827.1 hypothetical protein HanPSC8_Chr11g0481071 [Helianthus annuus]
MICVFWLRIHVLLTWYQSQKGSLEFSFPLPILGFRSNSDVCGIWV